MSAIEPDTRRLHPDDRVTLTRTGRVAYERSGFALVRWDDGGEALVWTADLTLEENADG